MLIAGATPYGAVGMSSSSSSGSNWLGSAMTAIKNAQNQGGLLGMLQDAANGSSSSFLAQNASFANDMAQISQTSVTSASSFYAQIATQNIQDRNAEVLQKTFGALTQSQNMVQAKNVLGPVIYFSDGTTIDTNANIMTKPDGTQYDTTTGAKYVDPASIIQMANGAYLDTQNNILTLADGTQIDTVTGLTISTTA
jgi:hypothetical protein